MSKGIGMPLIGLEQVSKEALAENCKAAQEQLKQAREEIASMNDSNFKLYNQTEEQFKIIQDQKKEMEVLKAKLEKCKEQRDKQLVDNYKMMLGYMPNNNCIVDLNEQLAAITIDSIKRGE